jgi:hypothetical protein
MKPANVPLCLTPGTTNRSTLRVMQPQYVYREITAIDAAAPVRLTVPGHGITTDSWHCWINRAQQMPELNREPTRQLPHKVSVIDANTLEINRISATGRQPTGGELVYQPPVDLTGADVAMKIFNQPGGAELLELGIGSGLTITGPGTIEREIAASVVIPDGAGWYWVEVRYPDGSEFRYWEGSIILGNA